jgi:hypothetical protein
MSDDAKPEAGTSSADSGVAAGRTRLKVDPHDVLWVTDTELIRRSGVPENIMRARLQALDRDRRSGFPRKQEFFANRRYWPAVVRYFDHVGGLVALEKAPFPFLTNSNEEHAGRGRRA